MRRRFIALLMTFFVIVSLALTGSAASNESDVPQERIIPSASVQGRPTALIPGKVFGCFIWQAGDRWYLKTSSIGDRISFTGKVLTAGSFFSVTALNGQGGDSVRLNEVGNVIRFTFKTGGRLIGFLVSGRGDDLQHEWPDTGSGLTFVISDGSTPKFILYANGKLVGAADIYIGRGNRHPIGGVFERLYTESEQNKKKADDTKSISPE